ncbi:MAG: hypothetical protein Q9160_003608 [Pyrenula sp. 1 TL-2023]
MSGAATGAAETTKLQEKKPEGEPPKEQQNQAPNLLEEDDEFEDFPVEDWTAEEATAPGGNTHLWEESWDDDDQNEEFSKQLKEELKKVSGSKS